jgi:hypothetical protein
MNYLELLDRFHSVLKPAVYLEIGVDVGMSLILSQSRSIAVDPAPKLQPEALEGKPWVKLFQQPSDDFFATHTAAATLAGHPLDLAFIDGLHEFAQVVRDLENIERWGHAATVVVIHDVLPYNAWHASRHFHEGAWTGDVWRIVPFLRDYRPELSCRLIDAAPTGVLVVTGLNAESHGMAGVADALDREFPKNGTEYARLVDAYIRASDPEPPEGFLRVLPGEGHPIPHRVESRGWLPLLGGDALQPLSGVTEQSLRVLLQDPARLAFRLRLSLIAKGMAALRLALRGCDRSGAPRERNVYLDVERPGALYHELERVALHTNPSLAFFELELEGALESGEELHEIVLSPASSDYEDVPATQEMAIRFEELGAEQIAWPKQEGRFLPERFADRPRPDKRRTGTRDAVVFAWFVPERMPELGEYYLGLLRYHHPDSKLFIGMNHGSDPVWEDRFRASGLDAEVRWARPEVGDFWDATGFLTALEGFHHSEERFDLVWFGHTKGASDAAHTDYHKNRIDLLRNFWGTEVGD